MIVTFDFDDTLANNDFCEITNKDILNLNIPIYEKLIDHYENGDVCILLTARWNLDFDKNQVVEFLKTHNIYSIFSDLVFTNMELKGFYAYKLKSDLHYDDDLEQLKSVEGFGIKVVNSKEVK